MPSLGFVLLFTTLVFSVIFVQWAFSPLDYEKEMIYERNGHLMFKKKQFNEAVKFFIKSAEISQSQGDKARRYRYVGISLLAMKNKSDAIKYFRLSLKHNPNEEYSTIQLKKLENKKVPTKMDDALELEQIGHRLFQEKKFADAKNYFARSAELSVSMKDKGKRYRYVAVCYMGLDNKHEAIKYFKLSLKYNPNDDVSKTQLTKLEIVK